MDARDVLAIALEVFETREEAEAYACEVERRRLLHAAHTGAV